MTTLAVTWWCSALRSPWSWSWRPYPGVWAFIAVLLFLGAWAERRGRRSGRCTSRRRQAAFLAGVAVSWGASDWPLGTLGAGYLATAHVIQYVLYAFVAAPLLMLGTPEWFARSLVERLHLTALFQFVSRPLAAGIVFNLVLIATHVPLTVDAWRSNQFGSFLLDMAWLGSGLILWLPLISPLPELALRSYPIKMLYLFFAAGGVAMVPAGFLTWSEYPLYSTYELAPRVAGIKAIDDQQLAGVIMVLGTMPIVWGVLATMMHRWARSEADATPAVRAAGSRAPI